MESFKIKDRTEHWIFFKILKLPVIFFGTYFGLLLLISLLSIGGKGGRSRPVFWAEYTDQVSTVLFWVSGVVLVCYLYSKLKHSEIDEFLFDDETRRLRITFRNYLLHFKYSKSYPYTSLSFTSRPGNSFVNGEYEHLEFFAYKKRIAVISGSSVDWHRLPNAVHRIKFKLTGIVHANNG